MKRIFALLALCAVFFPSCVLRDIRMYAAMREAKQGDPQKAVALYLSIDPALQNPVIAYNCAVLYSRLKEYQAAQNLYERIADEAEDAVPERGRASSLFNSALIFYDGQDNAKALERLRRALVLSQEKDILALYQAILAGINPGSGVSSVTQVTGVIGTHDSKEKVLFIAPVPYGVLFPGSAETGDNAGSDH